MSVLYFRCPLLFYLWFALDFYIKAISKVSQKTETLLLLDLCNQYITFITGNIWRPLIFYLLMFVRQMFGETTCLFGDWRSSPGFGKLFLLCSSSWGVKLCSNYHLNLLFHDRLLHIHLLLGYPSLLCILIKSFFLDVWERKASMFEL